jgi:tRNA(fMet)-specific endonuclease VapC
MLFLLDTNAISDIVREQPRMMEKLAALPPADDLTTCTIVRGELLFGVERLPPGKRQVDLRRRIEMVLGSLRCEPVVEGVGDHYARAKRACQVKGLPLDENDLWIAGTALASSAVL